MPYSGGGGKVWEIKLMCIRNVRWIVGLFVGGVEGSLLMDRIKDDDDDDDGSKWSPMWFPSH